MNNSQKERGNAIHRADQRSSAAHEMQEVIFMHVLTSFVRFTLQKISDYLSSTMVDVLST